MEWPAGAEEFSDTTVAMAIADKSPERLQK